LRRCDQCLIAARTGRSRLWGRHDKKERILNSTRNGIFILALLAAVLAVSPASAKDGRDVLVSGACTASSTSKLKLSPENGRIEVEFEVDQNRNGVVWRVALYRNGVRVTSTTATTRGPSGSFEARRVISRAGAPMWVTAGATRASGERCSARASI
jgi:hypothetical protein